MQRLGLRGAVRGKLQAEHALGTEREAVAERVLWWWLRWGWRPTVQAACPRAASKSTDAADAAPRPVIAAPRSSHVETRVQGGALSVAARLRPESQRTRQHLAPTVFVDASTNNESQLHRDWVRERGQCFCMVVAALKVPVPDRTQTRRSRGGGGSLPTGATTTLPTSRAWLPCSCMYV